MRLPRPRLAIPAKLLLVSCLLLLIPWVGYLYVRELDDKDQGVFAFAQALAQDPEHDTYAVDLERAAGNDMKVWAEALQILSQASTNEQMAAEPKIALFNRLGPWYSEKIARPDLGLPCFQFVLGLDPAKTNVDGGAIALTHPLAASGARITVHLLHELRRRGARYGLGSACIGGGQGGAVVVEALA